MRSILLPVLLTMTAPAFAAQSAAVATTSGGHSRSSVTVTVPFGKAAQINHQVFRPVAVVQDSSCPVDVQCVWAGQLIVEFQTAGRKRVRLEQGKPLAIAGGRLTLVSASPSATSGVAILPQRYRFQLRFESP